MRNNRNLRARSLRSFLVFAVAAFLLGWLWSFATSGGAEEDIPPVFRSVHEFNGRLWHSLFRTEHPAPEFAARPPGKRARVNGDIGLLSRLDLADWVLDVNPNAQDPGVTHLKLKMSDLRALPRVQSTFEFKCIEGWSEINSYAGVRFSDFLKAFQLGSHSKENWKGPGLAPGRFLYVGLETPDGEYYVSLDMESMLHPQTLLAYEMNGVPLTAEHGAPLRLIIPVKYGIKSLKRIGKIYFSDQRPPDYWAERGYDWYSGL